MIAKARIVSFGAIGAIGFIVDAGILQGLFMLGVRALPARLVSFPIAVTATWLLNRRYTFGDRPQAQASAQYVLYVGGQVAGALINVAAFIVTIHYYPEVASRPLIPMIVGSALALIFNYSWANALVFRSGVVKTS